MSPRARLLCVLAACALPALAQPTFTPSPELAASVLALPIQPGLWEIRRNDVRDGKPYEKCMGAGDWEIAKSRALGLSLAPVGCPVQDVVLRGNMVRTTFACKDYNLMEEFEFAGTSFRNRAVEMAPGLPKGGVVLDSTGTHKGPC